MTSPAFIDNKSHKLNLGSSFRQSGNTAFHTARYDFKPASVDNQREGVLEIGSGNEVTISLPNVQGSKTPCTVYKGNKKPVQKECVLIYDNITGEFTLERMTSQIQVKKTRDSGNSSFPSNPTLHPVTSRMPKPHTKKQSKSAKVSGQKIDGVGKIKDSATSGGTSTTASAFKSTTWQHHAPVNEVIPAAEAVLSSDDDNNSSSDPDSGSSSDENEKLAPIPNTSIFHSLADDLNLSESDSDSN